MGQTPHFRRETASNKGVSSPKQACSAARWFHEGCRPDHTPRRQLRRLRGPGRGTRGLFGGRLSSHALPTAAASAACPEDQSPKSPVHRVCPSSCPLLCPREMPCSPSVHRDVASAAALGRPSSQPSVRGTRVRMLCPVPRGKASSPLAGSSPSAEAASAFVSSVCHNQRPHTGHRRQHKRVLSRFWRPEVQNRGVTGPRMGAPPEQALPHPSCPLVAAGLRALAVAAPLQPLSLFPCGFSSDKDTCH